jgi:hypothetical protein
MYGLCTGDFNRSFNPSLPKTASTTLHLISDGSTQTGPGQEFGLPLRMANAGRVGAVSLILNFPANLVEVQDVIMNVAGGQLDWAVNGNELRIGWYSLIPLDLDAADVLLTLNLKTTLAFVEDAKIQFTLAADPLNELADDDYNVIQDALLSMGVVDASTTGIQEGSPANELTLSNHPNPFNGSTTIAYTLPIDGNVTLEIRNLLGETVKVPLNETQQQGYHSLKLDAASLPTGIYIATLTVKNENNKFVRTIKLVRNH